ncbi:hypothetical protein F8388_001406 [Cannabis sativa]|uniref:Non-specific serine/threonine protein kinase n=1 Tax=Cannabis sativa TaxID=3483 RepID=A0A7J6GN14_CANSA|nr:hypothetical protein F8388_001406 [Cannabis sativa]
MAANPITVLFFLLITQILLFTISTAQQNNTTKMISLNSSISTSTNNSYWLSNSGQFAFGFYKQGNGFAIGIWFDKLKEKTVIWTANRDQQQPLPQSTTLALNDFANSVSPDQPAASASLLDSGNFVLYNSDSEPIWQSFKHPTDTILSGQRLETGKVLISADSNTNHSSGRFQVIMQTDGNLILRPTSSGVLAYHTYWYSSTDGNQNTILNLDLNGQLDLMNSTSKSIIKTIHAADLLNGRINNVTYRLTIDADGILRLYSHNLFNDNSWSIEWNSTNNRCAPTGLCGNNAYCDISQNEEPNCICLPGFDFINQNQKSLGCERNGTNINYCTKDNSDNDHNTRMFSVKVVDGVLWENGSNSSSVPINNKFACEKDCLDDCNCEIALFANNICNKLLPPLRYSKAVDTQSGETATTIVKVRNENYSDNPSLKEVKKGQATHILVIGIVCIVFSTIILFISMFLFWKSHFNSSKKAIFVDEVLAVRSFTYNELEIATKSFAQQLECENKIIHCDINPNNILIDENRCAKISDFGLAKLLMPDQTKTNTGIRGTRGFVAPEWHKGQPITTKVDVYSFGIVLLVIICCRPSVDASVPEKEAILVDWVDECFRINKLRILFQDDEVDEVEFHRLVKIGLWCIQEDPTIRPTMKKVVSMFEDTLVDIPIPPCNDSSSYFLDISDS